MFYLAQIGAIYLNRFLGLFSGISKFKENFLFKISISISGESKNFKMVKLFAPVSCQIIDVNRRIFVKFSFDLNPMALSQIYWIPNMSLLVGEMN